MRQAFFKALERVPGPVPGIAVISFLVGSAGAAAETFERWDALYGLYALVDLGWTVALPAFTFSFCGGRAYHHADSSSETGVLADWLLAGDRSALRTAHPIYSFVVAGPEAARIAACPSTTTFADDSPFGLFAREDATIVMLGCGWEYCTLFHRPEEKAAVPHRYYKDFTGTADFGDGRRAHEGNGADVRARPRAERPKRFRTGGGAAARRGWIATVPLWRGTVEAIGAAALERTCDAMLAEDGFTFVENSAVTAHRHGKLKQAAKQAPLRIAVLGNANVHHLVTALAAEMAALLADRKAEIHQVPYGQLRQGVLDPRSELRRLRSRNLDFLRPAGGSGRAADAGGRRPGRAAGACRGVRRDHRRPPRAERRLDRGALLRRPGPAGRWRWRQGCGRTDCRRQRLADGEAGGAGPTGLAGPGRRGWRRDGRGDGSAAVVSRPLPRSPNHSAAVSPCAGPALPWPSWAGACGWWCWISTTPCGWRPGRGKHRRAAVGRGDYPGTCISGLPEGGGSATERGIALAVCSKNDEDLALQALETLPDMQIRSRDLVAHRDQLAAQSRQHPGDRRGAECPGLESILFIDDNPVEREAVRRSLPGIKVLDLPADPALYVQALVQSPWLEVASVTAEDRKRVGSYMARRQIEQQRTAARRPERLLRQPADEVASATAG